MALGANMSSTRMSVRSGLPPHVGSVPTIEYVPPVYAARRAAQASRPSVKSCQIPVKFLSNSADASRPSVKSPSNPRPLHAHRARHPSKFRGRPALCQIPSIPVKFQTPLSGPCTIPLWYIREGCCAGAGGVQRTAIASCKFIGAATRNSRLRTTAVSGDSDRTRTFSLTSSLVYRSSHAAPVLTSIPRTRRH